jgi:hypothetical protein
MAMLDGAPRRQGSRQVPDQSQLIPNSTAPLGLYGAGGNPVANKLLTNSILKLTNQKSKYLYL